MAEKQPPMPGAPPGLGEYSREEVQRIMMSYQQYEKQLEVLEEQLQQFQKQKSSLAVSQDSVKGIQKVKEDHEIMIPIGNILVKAKLTEPETVFVRIGAGVVEEKHIDDALPYLEDLEENFAKYIGQIQEQIQSINQRMQYLQPIVDSVYRAMSQRGMGGPPGG